MSEKGVFIGTSGWTYDDWAGIFYPKQVKAADRLIPMRISTCNIRGLYPGLFLGGLLRYERAMVPLHEIRGTFHVERQ